MTEEEIKISELETASTANITGSSYTIVNAVVGSTTITQKMTINQLFTSRKLPAGSSSTYIMALTEGSTMTSPTAGAEEFDGKVRYFTPTVSARGVVPAVQYSIVPAGDFALGTGTSVQSAFPTTGDVWTLNALTTYEIEGQYYITKSGTTCTVGLAFALAGGASVTSIDYVALSQSVAVNTVGQTQDTTWVNQVGATVVTTTATTGVWIRFKGIIRMNAGGTVTPQIIFSAGPTSPVMKADSFIKFTALGSNTQNIVGNVA